MRSGAEVYSEGYRAGIRPDPILTVSEWADEHRVLPPQASAEPGPWRTARTPYLREIMDCLSVTSPIVEVVFAGRRGCVDDDAVRAFGQAQVIDLSLIHGCPLISGHQKNFR